MVERLEVTNVEELKAVLARFDDDALYRGQVKHYGSLQAPAMNTSFSRQGCDPPNMLKWLHYAYYALAALIGAPAQFHDREQRTQAILQHYGWRSWFLDASSDPAVSSWFASHVFSKQPTIEMLEDCFEIGVMLVRQCASYASSEGEGHLYVLSKTHLAEAGLGAIDLSAISLPNHRPRFHVQSAWLVGQLRENLPIRTILAHIMGPAEVFRAYAQSRGFTDAASVFPSVKEDPVLASLLSLPWEKICLPDDKDGGDERLDFFRRSLSLPEYFRDGYRKIMPLHYAFYRNTSIADAMQRGQVYVHSVPEIAMYGHAELTMRFPHVTALLGAHPHIAFEVDALIRLPESGPAHHYSKGISVAQAEDGTIDVGDLIVDHPGRRLTRVSTNMGWHYTADEKWTWTRVLRDDDCPCSNAWRHEHHLSALTIIEHYLAEAKQPQAASALST